MPAPLFRPAATSIFRAVLLLSSLFLAASGYAVFTYYHSPAWTRVGLAPDQPVLFSHRHHALELRIDCRFCHSSVESSPFAGMPSTQTCMTCHSQIFGDTAMLRPIVQSEQTGIPIHWNRVTDLPEFVAFDHSIHVAKGVGCSTCHGLVGDMALMSKGERLDMRWCVDCHRDPGRALRPQDQVYSLSWKPPADQASRGAALMSASGIEPAHLTNCTTCHR